MHRRLSRKEGHMHKMGEWLNKSLRRSKRLRSKKICNQETPYVQLRLTHEATSDFMSIVPDELLIEIFTRLPDVRSVFRCRPVCRRWSSLINHHERFFRSSHASVLFRLSPDAGKPFQGLLPERPGEPYDLEFLPDGPGAEVRASSGDLALVSRGPTNYYVCNPLTRQWVALPVFSPRVGMFGHMYQIVPRGYGLISEPKKKRYTVVVFNNSMHSRGCYCFSSLTFSSETGRWSELTFHQLFNNFGGRRFESLQEVVKPVATSTGFLHWLDGTSSRLRGIVAFNPLMTGKGRFVEFPAGLGAATRMPRLSHDKIRLEAVRGRLRLSRLVKVSKARSRLSIWELDESNGDGDGHGTWGLVHKVTLMKAEGMAFVLGMHPGDGNVVLVVLGRKIFRLEIRENKYDKVGELPGKEEPAREVVAKYLKAFAFDHSLFPTPVLQLPCQST